ncbi:DUF2282 domain-containing protein [Paraburkholderia sp. CNPSo 3157]|uniref:DUF2282 domain-containing protein n=1 Tax=Paraburkholderia franconis TaxID=2654983 RepID=A0A7X1NKA1_9BURK|nr:DUF2282 domain-containing protein [Paraburkholderia franconis]MPW23407.1 DUF2282 domain-containing protein [Paraburkholderia franconis]
MLSDFQRGTAAFNLQLRPGHCRERCFGIVRAGRNDCGTAKHACAGRAPRDAAGDEWLLLPAGTCTKIAGGAIRPASG